MFKLISKILIQNNINNFKIIELNKKTRNFVYLIKTPSKSYILKFYYKISRKQNELNFYENYFSFKIPRLINTGITGKKHWVLLEYVPGKTLKDALINDNEKKDVYFHIGYELGRLHSSSLQTISNENKRILFLSLLDEITFKIKKYNKYNELFRYIKYLKENISFVDKAFFCRIHGDLNSENIIINSENKFSKFIDFEQSNISIGYLDIYSYYIDVNDNECFKFFLKGYKKQNNLFNPENKFFYLIFLFLQACKRSLGHEEMLSVYRYSYKQLNKLGDKNLS